MEAAAGAGAGTGAGAAPELAGDCFMVAREVHYWWPSSMERRRRCAALPRRRCQPDSAAGRPGRSWRKQTTASTTCLGVVVAPDAALGERRGGASPTTRAAAHEDQGPSPRERERERGLSCWLGALPRELKRNAPCFSLFPRLLARPKREREREREKR